ncbi:MAG: hypothetical protein ACO2PN_21825 [Pyrobaculum sp.]|jgi:hypothetical protein
MNTKTPLKVTWRTTYMGGLTIPLGFRRVSSYVEYVKPAEKTESHGGTHGQYIYTDADIILLLEQTNITRYRYVTIYLCKTDKDLCHQLKELAEIVWQTTGSPKLTVTKILETYGNPAPR